MYRLRSSDINNDRYLAAVERFGDDIIERYRAIDFANVRDIIFTQEISGRLYDNIVFSLTVCDNFDIPITQREAEILFFTLQVNRAFTTHESPIQIKNFSQASILWLQCRGAFRELTRVYKPSDDQQFMILTAPHTFLFKDCNIIWKLPIYQFTDGETNKTYVSVAGAASIPYALIDIPAINLHNARVGRGIYIQAFETSLRGGKVLADSVDELASQFNATLEIVENALKSIGFAVFRIISMCEFTEYEYDSSFNALKATLEDELAVYDNELERNPDEIVYWKQLNDQTAVYLPNLAYVPIKNRQIGEIRIFKQ